jgi:hypothetical protein
MSVKIKNLTGEYFDLPKDYVIEATITNPLFSNKGPQTVPISFPTTANNRRLTGNAQRTDKAERPSATIGVIVDHGAVSQSGLLAVQSASESLISANIGWDESEMYASMNKTLLPDLPDLPVFSAGGNDLEERRDAMLSHLQDVMHERILTDYAIFPVVLKKDTAGDNDRLYLEVINDTYLTTEEEYEGGIGDVSASNGAIGGFRAKTNRILQRVHDGNVVPFDVPKCYGLSPFLRVWKVLDLIFSHYGFTLENNPFYEHEQLRKLVVLNNTMDAVITGYLSYKDMMPDVTVENFLDSLKNKFRLLYFINSNTRSVHLFFMRDIFNLSNRDEIDISRYKSAHPSINYKENKQLKLVANNEIEGTEVKYESYEDFLDAFNRQFHEEFPNSTIDSRDSRYTLFFCVWNRQYATRRPDLREFNYLSTDFFNWDKKDHLTYEDIKFADLSLPVLYDEKTIPETVNFQVLMYLVDYKHNHSDGSVSNKTVEKEQSAAKLAFAFSWGKSDIVPSSSSPVYNYAYASQDNRNWNGRFFVDSSGKRYDLSLYIQHADGLFNRFWKEYDAWLRHSGHEVNISLKMSEFELSKIKPYRKIMLDNQLYILEEARYQMGNSNKPVELKLRTIRLYEPYDLESEQSIATYTDQQYYWRGESVKTPNIEQRLDDLGLAYTIEGYRSYDEDGRSALIILPPTEEQYATQQTFQSQYRYEVKWYQGHTNQSLTITQTVTYYPELIT